MEDTRRREWSDRSIGGYSGRVDGVIVETPTHVYSKARAMLYPDRIVVRTLDGTDLETIVAPQEPVAGHPGWWQYGSTIMRTGDGCRTCGGTRITRK